MGHGKWDGDMKHKIERYKSRKVYLLLLCKVVDAKTNFSIELFKCKNDKNENEIKFLI